MALPMPMRVLVIVSCFAPGGAERQLIALLRGADQTRLQISVACLYRRNWHERAQAIPGVTIHHLGKSGRYAFIGVIWRAYRLARALQPDVVYGYMTPQDMIALLVGKLTGARVIWAIRNSHTPLGAHNLLHRFLVLAARALARFPNLIIANSSAGAADYEAAGYPAARIQVIPNGIDLTDFVRDEAGREEWCKHPEPEIWIELLTAEGFRHPKVRWTTPSRLGRFGSPLSARAIQYFLFSHFSLRMVRAPRA